MAPDAKLIACRNMNNGAGVIPMYLECMEWFIAPTKIDGTAPDPAKAPHVINNSWGCVEVCPPRALQDTLRAREYPRTATTGGEVTAAGAARIPP